MESTYVTCCGVSWFELAIDTGKSYHYNVSIYSFLYEIKCHPTQLQVVVDYQRGRPLQPDRGGGQGCVLGA